MDIKEATRVYESVKATRSNWDSHFREVERRIKPSTYGFGTNSTEGSKQREYIFDSTTVLALQKFASILVSFIFPERSYYHDLKPQDTDLEEDPSVLDYCDDFTKRLFQMRYAPRAGFTNAAYEFMMDIGAYGNGVIFTDERLGVGMKYECCDFANCWFVRGDHGVDIVFRDQYLSASYISNRWPDVSEKIHTLASREPSRMMKVTHGVMREKSQRNRFNIQGVYFIEGEKTVLENSGFYSMPYAAGTYQTWAGEQYGRGPAMMVLPDIKQINQMQREYINGVQMAFQPPLLLSDDGALTGFHQVPGALNFGMLDNAGRPKVQPMNSGGDPRIAEYGIEKARQTINDAFLINLFQVLVETPTMTATEVLERTKERGYLVGPTVSRINNSVVSTIVERELDIAHRSGSAPDMPQALAERGGRIKIEYDNALNKAQEIDKVLNFGKAIESSAALGQIDPAVFSRNINADAVFRDIVKVFSWPSDYLKSSDEAKQANEQIAQQQQAQGLVEALPNIAMSADRLAQAQATIQGA